MINIEEIRLQSGDFEADARSVINKLCNEIQELREIIVEAYEGNPDELYDLAAELSDIV